MSSPERRHLGLALAMLAGIAVLPVILPAFRIIDGLRGSSPASDFALLELSTSQALHGEQLLGPYSRFGWRHPGPAYFYLLAPFYAASGASSASLPVAALVLNWAAVLGMVACLRRWSDTAAVPLFALGLALFYGLYLGPGFLYNVWNPAVTILPFGLFLMLCAGLACGRTVVLPIIAGVGSFLIQTHLGYLPCVMTAVLTSGWFWFRRRRFPDDAVTAARMPLVLTVGTLALLWIMPVDEQLTRDPGNLTLILRFFMRGADGQAWGEAVTTVAREIAWPWSYSLFGSIGWYAPYQPIVGWRLAVCTAFALAQVGLLVVWAMRLRDRPFFRALACICLACTIVAVPATMRVSGEIRPYLTAWISMIGVVGSCAAIGPLLPYPSLPSQHWARAMGREQAALILAVGLAIAVAMVGRPLVRDSQFPPARTISDAVKTELSKSGIQRPHVAIQTRSPELFFAASAVLLQLHKAGMGFSVDRPWWNFFGEKWHPVGVEDGLIDFRIRPSAGMPTPLMCVPNGASEVCVSVGQRPATTTR